MSKRCLPRHPTWTFEYKTALCTCIVYDYGPQASIDLAVSQNAIILTLDSAKAAYNHRHGACELAMWAACHSYKIDCLSNPMPRWSGRVLRHFGLLLAAVRDQGAGRYHHPAGAQIWRGVGTCATQQFHESSLSQGTVCFLVVFFFLSRRSFHTIGKTHILIRFNIQLVPLDHSPADSQASSYWRRHFLPPRRSRFVRCQLRSCDVFQAWTCIKFMHLCLHV